MRAEVRNGRDYRVGYGLGVLDRDEMNFELGVGAQRWEMPMQGQASNGGMGRATLESQARGPNRSQARCA